MRLKVKAYILPDFDFEKRSLNLGRLRHGAGKTVTIKLLHRDADTPLSRIETSGDGITARLIENEAPNETVLEISAAAELPIGRIEETVTAFRKRGRPNRAELRITGQVTGDIQASPRTLFLRADPDSLTNITGQITLTKGSAQIFAVDSVSDEQGHLELSLTSLDEGRSWRIDAHLVARPDSAQRWLQGEISALTDSESQPEVRVPYRVMLMSRSRQQ